MPSGYEFEGMLGEMTFREIVELHPLPGSDLRDALLRCAELACRGIVELVTAYLDDALEPAGRERFEEHVAFCEGCNRYLEQMRLTIEATGHLGVERLPAELEERLLEAFRGWRGS
jgi:hypothetical protein